MRNRSELINLGEVNIVLSRQSKKIESSKIFGSQYYKILQGDLKGAMKEDLKSGLDNNSNSLKAKSKRELLILRPGEAIVIQKEEGFYEVFSEKSDENSLLYEVRSSPFNQEGHELWQSDKDLHPYKLPFMIEDEMPQFLMASDKPPKD